MIGMANHASTDEAHREIAAIECLAAEPKPEGKKI